jgi:hypothetical protein
LLTGLKEHEEAITALRTAIQEAEKVEPVAWGMPDAVGNIVDTITENDRQEDTTSWSSQYTAPLYLAPPPAQPAKPLSDAEIDAAWRSVDYTQPYEQFRMSIGRAIEAKLKERNT